MMMNKLRLPYAENAVSILIKWLFTKYTIYTSWCLPFLYEIITVCSGRIVIEQKKADLSVGIHLRVCRPVALIRARG